jgi:hypothetical protein
MDKNTKIMIIVIFVLSTIVVYNFVTINIFQEKTTNQITELSDTDSILTENIQLVKTNISKTKLCKIFRKIGHK